MREGCGGASGGTVRGAGFDGAPDGAAFSSPIATLAVVAVLALVFVVQWWLNSV